MILAAFAMLQAVVVAGPPAPAKPAAPVLPVATAPCPRDSRGDIVVCGSTDKNEQYRLRPLPERYEDPNRVIMMLPGNAKLMPEIQRGRTYGEGQVALTYKIPF